MRFMATRESHAARGARRSRMLRLRTAEELGARRRASGVSLRAVAGTLGVSVDRLVRLERGDPASLTIDLGARYASVLGLELAVTLHPAGAPIRDQGHVALLDRFRRRMPPGVRWRTEVPIPIIGDPRSADGVVYIPGVDCLVEAETHLGDFQALERRLAGKARDLGAHRTVLLLADTRHNRRLVRDIAAIRDRFPVGAGTWFQAVAAGRDPGADALVIL